jgi:hypothetical protein
MQRAPPMPPAASQGSASQLSHTSADSLGQDSAEPSSFDQSSFASSSAADLYPDHSASQPELPEPEIVHLCSVIDAAQLNKSAEDQSKGDWSHWSEKLTVMGDACNDVAALMTCVLWNGGDDAEGIGAHGAKEATHMYHGPPQNVRMEGFLEGVDWTCGGDKRFLELDWVVKNAEVVEMGLMERPWSAEAQLEKLIFTMPAIDVFKERRMQAVRLYHCADYKGMRGPLYHPNTNPRQIHSFHPTGPRPQLTPAPRPSPRLTPAPRLSPRLTPAPRPSPRLSRTAPPRPLGAAGGSFKNARPIANSFVSIGVANATSNKTGALLALSPVSVSEQFLRHMASEDVHGLEQTLKLTNRSSLTNVAGSTPKGEV